MPDQSSAASEHAILQEITAPLETLPDDPVALVQADFPHALRGYDRIAVDAYVQQVTQLVAELQATRSPEAAVRRALERVGEQISGILQRAHDTAEQITAQSRGEAEDRLEHARVEAAEILASARQKVKDLDADTDRIWIERHRIIDDARELAAQLQSVAETADERFAEAAEHSPAPGAAGQPTAPEAADEFEPEDGEAAMQQTDVFLEDAYDADAESAGDPEAGPAAEAEAEAEAEDLEATRRFEPLEEDVTVRQEQAPEEGEPTVRGTRASIPPASQAASRRASR